MNTHVDMNVESLLAQIERLTKENAELKAKQNDYTYYWGAQNGELTIYKVSLDVKKEDIQEAFQNEEFEEEWGVLEKVKVKTITNEYMVEQIGYDERETGVDDKGVEYFINPNDETDFIPCEPHCYNCGYCECECDDYEPGKWFNRAEGKWMN